MYLHLIIYIYRISYDTMIYIYIRNSRDSLFLSHERGNKNYRHSEGAIELLLQQLIEERLHNYKILRPKNDRPKQ